MKGVYNMQHDPKKQSFRTLNLKSYRILSFLRNFIAHILFIFLRVVIRHHIDPNKHSLVIPEATYSPWLSDIRFQNAFSKVKNNTFVDFYKLYELWQLTGQVAKLTGDIIEVGVWRGGSGCLIAERCQIDEIPGTVFLCDTFSGVVKTGEYDSFYVGGEYADTSKETVMELIKTMNLRNVEIITGIFPEDSGDKIKQNKFKLCHIDVDTYESAKDIVSWIWPRIVIGGMVVYDDYGHSSTDGVRKFVDSQYHEKDKIVVHNLNGHAVVIKIA